MLKSFLLIVGKRLPINQASVFSLKESTRAKIKHKKAGKISRHGGKRKEERRKEKQKA
jgi:hypothetical protein